MNNRCPQCVEHYAAARAWRSRTALRRLCRKIDRFSLSLAIAWLAVTWFVLGAAFALFCTFIAFYL
jgi:hypothetical protein